MTTNNDLRVSLLGMGVLCMAGSVVIAFSLASTPFPVEATVVPQDDPRREALRLAAEVYGYRLEPIERR